MAPSRDAQIGRLYFFYAYLVTKQKKNRLYIVNDARAGSHYVIV
jgi:hypothetical protein